MSSSLFMGFCKRPHCSAESRTTKGHCWTHARFDFLGEDCSWCGAAILEEHDLEPFTNRAGEVFCSKSHRQASNAARDALLRSEA